MHYISIEMAFAFALSAFVIAAFVVLVAGEIQRRDRFSPQERKAEDAENNADWEMKTW